MYNLWKITFFLQQTTVINLWISGRKSFFGKGHFCHKFSLKKTLLTTPKKKRSLLSVIFHFCQKFDTSVTYFQDFFTVVNWSWKRQFCHYIVVKFWTMKRILKFHVVSEYILSKAFFPAESCKFEIAIRC